MQEKAEETDWLAILQGDMPPPKGETIQMHQCRMHSLFASDLDYFATGLARDQRLEYTVDQDRRMIDSVG
jgi:hypothetical protein